MSSSLPVLVGLRYWRARKDTRFVSFITVFSVLGIALGVAALITVSSVMNGLEGRLKDQILGAVPQLVVHKPSNIDAYTPLLAEQPGVQAAVPMLSTEAMVQHGARLDGVMLLGVDPVKERSQSIIADKVVLGSWQSLQPGQFHILLGNQLARKLNLYVGDSVRVMAAKGARYTPMGRLPSQRKFVVGGIFDMGLDLGGHLALIHIDDAARLLKQKPDIRLYLDDAFMAPSIGNRLKEKFVESGQTAPNIQDWRDEYGQLFAAVKMEKRMMVLLLGLVVAVAAFNIVSALVMMVKDKTADVAIFKTMGLGRSQIMTVFSVQGMSSSTLGTLLGLVSGLTLALTLDPLLGALGVGILPPGQSLPVIIQPGQVAAIVIGALVLSFFATIYPAWRASTVNPAEVLRYE